MSVKKADGGWKAQSYISGKWFKKVYKTKKAAKERAYSSRVMAFWRGY